jgi:hypothetical protein
LLALFVFSWNIFFYVSFLTSLNAKFNRIRSLPSTFAALSHLTTLWLSNNYLEALPDSFGDLKRLRVLYLDSNELVALPESFVNLESLSLLAISRNKIESLPESIGNLANLLQLHVSHNCLIALPDSLCDLQKLKILVTENNEDLGDHFQVDLESREEVVEIQTVLRNRRTRKEERVALFEKVFRRIDVNGDGSLQKEEIVSLLDISGLEKSVCGEIWEQMLQLNDHSHTMGADKFEICMGLISQAQNGLKMDPDALREDDVLPEFPDFDKLNPFKRIPMFGEAVQEEVLEQRLLQLEMMHSSNQKELELKLTEMQSEELRNVQQRQEQVEEELRKVRHNSRAETKVRDCL